MKFLDLQIQYKAYQKEIDEAIEGVVKSGRFIGGPVISSLENALSDYSGGGYTLACSSGTDALMLALMSLDIGPGDEVITTPYSFIATAEVIALLRAKTVFVDVDSHTFNIDVSAIVSKITNRTKVVIPVSLFGQTADMDTINSICEDRNISVLEDAAQSFGAIHGDKKSCNISLLAATSFFPAKPLGCYGDGGAVFTKDKKLAEKIRMLLNHGQNQKYYHDYIGINGRLDALQAAVLMVKLKHFDKELQSRNRIAEYYSSNIDTDLFTPQKIGDNRKSAYAQYCLTISYSYLSPKSRENISSLRQKVRDYLSKQGVPTAVYYPVPLHLQKPFLALGYKLGDFPISESLSESMFAIPIHPFLNQEEQQKVVSAVNDAGRAILKKISYG